MRRLARHLFTLCSALSLLLCVAVCVLWVRSYWLPEEFCHVTFVDSGQLHARLRTVISDRGALGFEATDSDRRPDPRWGPRQSPGFHYVTPAQHPPVRAGDFLGRAGFASKRTLTQDAFARVTWRRYAVPYWPLAAATAALPLAWILRRNHWRHARRVRAGLCPSCGYDLRASPDRCPECGTVTAGKLNA